MYMYNTKGENLPSTIRYMDMYPYMYICEHIYTYPEQECYCEGGDEEEDELFDEPGGPQHPQLEAHHEHGLSDTSLLLQHQLLWIGDIHVQCTIDTHGCYFLQQRN